MNIRNSKLYRVLDPKPGIELEKIKLHSVRARSIYARKKEDLNSKDEFHILNGAILAMENLEYHYKNFQSKIGSGREQAFEALAYLNALWRIRNLFLKQNECLEEWIEKILRIFRSKYAAHREIDDNKNARDAFYYLELIIGGNLKNGDGNIYFSFCDGPKKEYIFALNDDHIKVMNCLYDVFVKVLLKFK